MYNYAQSSKGNNTSFNRNVITPNINPSRSYQFNESSLPYIPYQRSISSNDIYSKNRYSYSNVNHLQTIPEDKYNPYSRTILQRNYNGNASYNNHYYNNYIDRNNYYVGNRNTSLRNSNSYYNNTEGNQRYNLYGSQDIYRDVPVYQQKAVDWNIQPSYNIYNNNNYGEYRNHNRYLNQNYYSMNVDSPSVKLPAIKPRSYYDNYTADLKSHYKDNFVWYGKSKYENDTNYY